MRSRNDSLPEPVRLVIAESTRMSSELLADALRRDSRMTIIGCASDWSEVASILPKRPQIFLLGNDFERVSGGLEAAQRLIERDPQTRIVMLVNDGSDHNAVLDAFRAGARGVFSRAESVTAIAKCIEAVHKGQIWATSEQLGYLLDSLKSLTPPRCVGLQGLQLLSDREQDVVRYVAEGLCNREIAQKMNLSGHTVKNHLFRIYNKLGISSRIEIVFAAMTQRSTRPELGGALGQGAQPEADAELFEWYLRQADHVAYAQYMVGRMYMEGRGVEKNELTGYMWLLLAEENVAEVIAQSRAARKDVAARIGRGRIEEARREALKHWQVHHPEDAHTPPLLLPDSREADDVASETVLAKVS